MSGRPARVLDPERADRAGPAPRHLHTHAGHLTYPNPLDRLALTGEAIGRFTLSGEAEALRARLGRLAARGVTELVCQPAGPDIVRELTRFAAAAGLG